MAGRASPCFEIASRLLQAVRALDDKLNPHAGAQPANERLITVGFSGAKTMIKMGCGQFEMKLAADRCQRMEQRHRVSPARKREQDPLAAQLREFRKKASDRINHR